MLLFHGVLSTMEQQWRRQWLGAEQTTGHHIKQMRMTDSAYVVSKLLVIKRTSKMYAWFCNHHSIVPVDAYKHIYPYPKTIYDYGVLLH